MPPIQNLPADKRCATPYHHIDPGFINKRLCFSTFGTPFVNAFAAERNHANDHWSELSNNHLIVNLALHACRRNQVRSLGEVLQAPCSGDLFCSTEQLEGTQDAWNKGRARNRVLLAFGYDKQVFLDFHTQHFVCDTGREEQTQNVKVSLIGGIRSISEGEVVARPLIMGAPSFVHPSNPEDSDFAWGGWDLYEILPSDIGQFASMRDVPDPVQMEWAETMRGLPERRVKEAFCEILGDLPKSDWGGEQADHFSASVHLGTRRVTAAFLFKGPGAGFREMTPDMLGKRADQIHRLSCTSARLLVTQHCHDIGDAVRATLRAFAVRPHDPRQYCLITGRDTFRILKAYQKL